MCEFCYCQGQSGWIKRGSKLLRVGAERFSFRFHAAFHSSVLGALLLALGISACKPLQRSGWEVGAVAGTALVLQEPMRPELPASLMMKGLLPPPLDGMHGPGPLALVPGPLVSNSPKQRAFAPLNLLVSELASASTAQVAHSGSSGAPAAADWQTWWGFNQHDPIQRAESLRAKDAKSIICNFGSYYE